MVYPRSWRKSVTLEVQPLVFSLFLPLMGIDGWHVCRCAYVDVISRSCCSVLTFDLKEKSAQ